MSDMFTMGPLWDRYKDNYNVSESSVVVHLRTTRKSDFPTPRVSKSDENNQKQGAVNKQRPKQPKSKVRRDKDEVYFT